jgi:formate/nitrite transporter FocA (FNT family)
LKIEKILFEADYPILFSCTIHNDVYIFICHECQNKSIKWIASKTTYSILNKLLEDKITIREAFLRSLGCGAMMYIAVDGYKNNNHPLTVIMPVMCFILCGFDHCIANYGYMAMNGDLFCWQLPVWVVGNGLGSLMIRMLTSKEPTSFKLI